MGNEEIQEVEIPPTESNAVAEGDNCGVTFVKGFSDIIKPFPSSLALPSSVIARAKGPKQSVTSSIWRDRRSPSIPPFLV